MLCFCNSKAVSLIMAGQIWGKLDEIHGTQWSGDKCFEGTSMKRHSSDGGCFSYYGKAGGRIGGANAMAHTGEKLKQMRSV